MNEYLGLYLIGYVLNMWLAYKFNQVPNSKVRNITLNETIVISIVYLPVISLITVLFEEKVIK